MKKAKIKTSFSYVNRKLWRLSPTTLKPWLLWYYHRMVAFMLSLLQLPLNRCWKLVLGLLPMIYAGTWKHILSVLLPFIWPEIEWLHLWGTPSNDTCCVYIGVNCPLANHHLDHSSSSGVWTFPFIFSYCKIIFIFLFFVGGNSYTQIFDSSQSESHWYYSTEHWSANHRP